MVDATPILNVVMLEKVLLEKKGQSFEDFFGKIGNALWGADFEIWKNQGKFGDHKCDGYLISEKTVFQCYAPEQSSPHKFATKINADFEGARNHFKHKMERWVFVHNQQNGLHVTTRVLLAELRENHPNIKIESWEPKELIRQLRMSPDNTLGILFPELVKNSSFSEATWEMLEEGVKAHRATSLKLEVDMQNLPNRNALDDVLENIGNDDQEIRRRVLGYSRWYDPADKDQIVEILSHLGHEPKTVEINAQRLRDAGLIQITDNYYFPLNVEVCQQAAESLMDEFLQELGD